MSATTMVTPTARPDWSVPPVGAPGVPFRRLMHAELRKLVDTRAGRGLLIAIAAATLAALVIVVLVSDPDGLAYSQLVTGGSSIQLLLLPALGVLAATGEWSQRTGMTTFTQEPRRGRVGLAKLLSSLILAIVCTAVVMVLAAIAHLVAVGADQTTANWALDGSQMLGMVIMQLLVVSQGLAFGMLFLSTPIALVVYYILPNVWTLLMNLVSWLRDAAPWIDLSTSAVPLFDTPALTAEQWAQLVVTTLIWVVLPYVLGHARIARREVK